MKNVPLLLALFLSIAGFTQVSSKEKIPRKIKKSPQLYALYITRGANDQSEQVSIIYEYITSEIAYDYSALTDAKPYDINSSEKVFNSKLAISYSYCYLMKDMLAAIDIKSEVVAGYSHDSFIDSVAIPYKNSNYWLAIEINGEWKLADPTMDAGYIGKEKNNKEQDLLEKRAKEVEKFTSKHKKLNNKRDHIMKLKKLQKMDKKIYHLEEDHSDKIDDIEEELEEEDFYKNSIGFVQEPTKDWFLIHPDSFVVAHLPLNPMWQLRADTISIKDFAQGEEYLKERLAIDKGGEYDFNKHIEEYTKLHEIDQLIWAAQDGKAYNDTNAHAMATNYHTYLRILFTKNFKTTFQSMNSKELNEVLAKIDTTLTYNKIAQKAQKAGNKFAKKYFSAKFKEAKDLNKMYTKTAKSGIKVHEKILDNLKKDLDKGDEDIEKLEKKVKKLEGKGSKVDPNDKDYLEFFEPFSEQLDSLEVLNNTFNEQHKIWSSAQEQSYLKSLAYLIGDNLYLINQRSYFVELNNYNLNYLISQIDSIYENNHNKILELYTDSLSLEMMDGLNDILKLQSRLTIEVQTSATEMKSKDGNYNSKVVIGYFNYHLHKNYNLLYNSKVRALDHNVWMYDILKDFTKYWKEIENKSEEQVTLEEKRNEYLLELQEKEDLRVVNIYESIEKNAKAWKEMTLKQLEKLSE